MQANVPAFGRGAALLRNRKTHCLGCSVDLVSRLSNRPYGLMGFSMASYGGSLWIQTGLTKSTDHPSLTVGTTVVVETGAKKVGVIISFSMQPSLYVSVHA